MTEPEQQPWRVPCTLCGKDSNSYLDPADFTMCRHKCPECKAQQKEIREILTRDLDDRDDCESIVRDLGQQLLKLCYHNSVKAAELREYIFKEKPDVAGAASWLIWEFIKEKRDSLPPQTHQHCCPPKSPPFDPFDPFLGRDPGDETT